MTRPKSEKLLDVTIGAFTLAPFALVIGHAPAMALWAVSIFFGLFSMMAADKEDKAQQQSRSHYPKPKEKGI